jgi:hypothetical protein
MMIHNCPDCGLVHDHASPASEDPAVSIARIQAENALKIAQLESRTEKHVADVAAETAIDVTEAEAEGDVAVAEVIAPELGDNTPPEDPAPVVIEAPAEPEQDDELTPPQAEHEHETEPLVSAHHRRTGLGLW